MPLTVNNGQPLPAVAPDKGDGQFVIDVKSNAPPGMYSIVLTASAQIQVERPAGKGKRPATVEQALRIADRRARIVVSGVEAPRRFEWTPLYFKEVALVGSNAFGQEVFEGKEMHAMEAYFELVARGLDVSPVITHRFRLKEYKDAFLALHAKGKNKAVKALFTFDAT